MSDPLLSRYPIDTSAIHKGDEFSVEKVEQITGLERDTTAFRLAALGLQSLIQKRTGFTVKALTTGGLRVLTDPEASEHNRRQFEHNMRGMFLRHELNLNVDRTALSEEQLARHDRALTSQAAYLAVLAREHKKVIRLEQAQDAKLLKKAPKP